MSGYSVPPISLDNLQEEEAYRETNENNEANETSLKVSFASLFSFVSYSLLSFTTNAAITQRIRF
jgi:hypothetical protein